MADFFVADETTPTAMYPPSLLGPAYIFVWCECRITILIKMDQSQHARHQTVAFARAIL